MVVVDLKARVRGITFVHLSDGRGWIFLVQPHLDGKQHKRRAGNILEECEAEVTRGDKEGDTLGMLPPTNGVVEVGLWTYVVGIAPVLALGAKLNGTYIQPGDVIKVDKRAFSDGMHPTAGGSGRRWLHLLDGRGWVPERDGTGTEVVSLRTRSMLNYPAHFKGLTNLDKPSASWMVGVA